MISPMQPASILETAVEHHQSGRLAAAEELYRGLLVQDPRNADALHLLGVLLGQRGEFDPATDLICKAIRLRPDFFDAHKNLGRIYADAGRLSDAIASYRKLVALRPTDLSAWQALGVALRMGKHDDEAIAVFRKVLAKNPQFADAYTELGALLRVGGKQEEALIALSSAARLQPNSAEAVANLAAVLAERGKLDEAEQAYRRAIQLNTNNPQLRVTLGSLLQTRSQPLAALAIFDEVIAVYPQFAAAYSARASVFAELNQMQNALMDHRRAIDLAPLEASVHLEMSRTLSAMGDLPAAEACCHRAIELNPQLSDAWECLGRIMQVAGRFAEASAAFKKSLEIQPKAMVSMLLGMMVQKTEAAEVDRLMALTRDERSAPSDRISAGFTVGKLLDEADRFDEAFSFYDRANALFKKTSAERGYRFDVGDLRQKVEAMREEFTIDFFQRRQGWGRRFQAPVFIVGMPRSGTTLVEQIASSHSRVFGAGELADIAIIRSQLASSNKGDSALLWTQDAINEAARKQEERFLSLGGGADRIIDKMPANIMNLGLIATLFPASRIIFCQRDARDTCLSCFFQLFGKHSIMFSYDLADCGQQLVEQHRLTAHWQKVLPLPTLFMQYEELVADLEGQSRRLVEFLGLDWEPSCLDFYKTNRPILTSSVWQVRQPIYTRSAGRWKHYEQHLSPLLEVLAAAGSPGCLQ